MTSMSSITFAFFVYLILSVAYNTDVFAISLAHGTNGIEKKAAFKKALIFAIAALIITPQMDPSCKYEAFFIPLRVIALPLLFTLMFFKPLGSTVKIVLIAIVLMISRNYLCQYFSFYYSISNYTSFEFMIISPISTFILSYIGLLLGSKIAKKFNLIPPKRRFAAFTILLVIFIPIWLISFVLCMMPKQ